MCQFQTQVVSSLLFLYLKPFCFFDVELMHLCWTDEFVLNWRIRVKLTLLCRTDVFARKWRILEAEKEWPLCVELTGEWNWGVPIWNQKCLSTWCCDTISFFRKFQRGRDITTWLVKKIFSSEICLVMTSSRPLSPLEGVYQRVYLENWQIWYLTKMDVSSKLVLFSFWAVFGQLLRSCLFFYSVRGQQF